MYNTQANTQGMDKSSIPQKTKHPKLKNEETKHNCANSNIYISN